MDSNPPTMGDIAYEQSKQNARSLSAAHARLDEMDRDGEALFAEMRREIDDLKREIEELKRFVTRSP